MPFDINIAKEGHGGSVQPIPDSQQVKGGLTILDAAAFSALANSSLDLKVLKPRQVAFTIYQIAQAVLNLRKTANDPIEQAKRLGLSAGEPVLKRPD